MDYVLNLILIIIVAIFVNNVVLAQFLGICPFLGVSKKVDTASGMGMAVTAVLVVATIVTYLIQVYVLNTFGLEYLQTIAFILVIAALVQMIEMILKKTMPALYQALNESPTLMTLSFCILMALNVVFSNVWGIILKEWKGCSPKTIAVLILGIVVLIISSF